MPRAKTSALGYTVGDLHIEQAEDGTILLSVADGIASLNRDQWHALMGLADKFSLRRRKKSEAERCEAQEYFPLNSVAAPRRADGTYLVAGIYRRNGSGG